MSSLSILLALSHAHAADVTCDGVDDLVVGAAYDTDPSAGILPGAVQILRGSTTSGLTATGDVFLHQDSAGVSDVNEGADYFGAAAAAGDVDGDGCDELVVGGPSEHLGATVGGAIWRLELGATATAITVASSTYTSQDSAGISDTAENYDQFGRSLVVADFDADGYDDVVIGIPGEDVGAIGDAGAIAFLRGSATGFTTVGQQFFHQDGTDVAGTAEAADGFGEVLATGDFDGDGYADLAIGMAGEDWVGTNEGAVHVMYGGPGGPSVVTPNDELWSAGQGGVAGTLANHNECGWALAVADFDGDGYDDLAVGCPGDDSPGQAEAGSVLVMYGSAFGFDAAATELWHQGTTGVSGTVEASDRFGHALTAGDYDGDGFGDLAIAAPYEDYALTNDGVVHVLFGASGGLTDVGNLLFAQDVAGVEGLAGSYEYFGLALTTGDYDDDGYDDLAVGSPLDDDAGQTEGGVVNVLYGSSGGPSTAGDQLWHQDVFGVDDTVSAYDHWADSLF